MIRSPRLALALALAPCLLPAQVSRPMAGPAVRLGFSTERLARIDRLLKDAVDSNRIAGAVALVLRDGQVVYEKAVGWAD
jgi:CubicO group peptidase (beta-lactamase class C family)